VRFDGRLEGCCSAEKIEGLPVALSHTCQTGRCVSPSRRPVHRIHLTALTRHERDSCTMVLTLLVHLHSLDCYIRVVLSELPSATQDVSIHSSYNILLSFPSAMHLPYNVTRERPLNVETLPQWLFPIVMHLPPYHKAPLSFLEHIHLSLSLLGCYPPLMYPSVFVKHCLCPL
jgi:hypothetical protein